MFLCKLNRRKPIAHLAIKKKIEFRSKSGYIGSQLKKLPSPFLLVSTSTFLIWQFFKLTMWLTFFFEVYYIFSVQTDQYLHVCTHINMHTHVNIDLAVH